MTPENIQGCDLHEGEFGKVGSVVIWKYFIDGKHMVAKARVEAIDEEEKQVTFNVVEGDLLKDFKDFYFGDFECYAWAKAAIVPGLVSLIVVPLLLYVIYPPSVKSSPDAPKLAKEKLEKMGPMSKNEIIMAVTLVLTVYFNLDFF
ncbi:hypothetical protein POM88_027534 [Heracleum sosnowskyi]|uniref:Bet v I/Major latex protein domain-containing protein n=1 Tax=Heracleum sosnowskyi TaxID=360622 RepID=A0AAD8MLK3_9APIA|nr:hypothetical protein POM88_027534 [Heracleum sosnowskyi]